MKTDRGGLAGMGKVYRFTLAQMIKGKANIISFLLMALTAIVSVPLLTAAWGGDQTAHTDIAAVYVLNDTEYKLSLEDVPIKNEVFEDTIFTELNKASSEELQSAEEGTDAKYIGDSDVFVRLLRDGAAFKVEAVTAENTVISEEELYECTDALCALLDEARYRQQNATPKQMEILTSYYDADVQSVSDYLEQKEDDFDARFGAQTAYSVLVLMFSVLVSSFIVQKVIEEKASRLVELLMVSVQPLALLLGKILAMMTYVFGMLAAMILMLLLSYKITGQFMDTTVIAEHFAAGGFTSELFCIGPAMVVIVVISLLLTYFTVSLYSGLIATGCSTMEDVEPANMVVVLTVMFGYFAAIVLSGIDHPALSVVVSLFPVISGFAAPVRYFTGDIGIGLLLLSWAVQIAVIAALAWICARVYRDLIMYRGSRIKMKGLFSMLKKRDSRGEGAH